MVKGLLASKSRISKRDTSIPRLELASGHMAANLARNLCSALRGWPIMSITIWMDSLVTLFWINKPGKPWKVFVSNKVKKLAEITEELKIVWKYCPTKTNLLSRSSYWRTLRMTAWMLRFVSNCRIKRKRNRKIGPLNTDEILDARTRWVKRVQDGGQTVIKSPGWKLEKDPQTEILKCKGRIKNYRPIYLGGGIFVSKLIKHAYMFTIR